DITQAQIITDKLQASVLAKYAREQLGISIGMALLQTGMTPQSLLADADRSLYRVKPAK
ncbi:MAG: diguanylate cyclase, partial [Chloroflexi bacterium]|nr:diguanylate cyclase [Chloroflexota bacterium]